jgi:hypothetical protein
MTPESVYAATRGLELLFNRTERSTRTTLRNRSESAHARSKSALPMPVYLYFDSSRALVRVSDELIIVEVAATPDLPEGAEEPLTWWLLRALALKPYLIHGYTARVDDTLLHRIETEAVEEPFYDPPTYSPAA